MNRFFITEEQAGAIMLRAIVVRQMVQEDAGDLITRDDMDVILDTIQVVYKQPLTE